MFVEYFQIPRDQWMEKKPTFPFGQIPVLEVDGVVVPQTEAIIRYAATLANLYPTDSYEALLVDSVVATIYGDLFEVFVKWIRTPDADKPQATATLMETELPEVMTKLDKYVAKISKGPFIVSKESVADLLIFQICSGLESGKFPFCLNGMKDLSKKYPSLANISVAFSALPKAKLIVA